MKSKKVDTFVHIMFALMIIIVGFPLLTVLIISFSNAEDIFTSGYQVIPKGFSLAAYKLIFANVDSLLKALGISLASSIVAPLIGTFICAFAGFGLSAKGFAYKKTANVFFIFAMLFNAGLVPTYIIYSKWYGLADNVLVYFIPFVSVWNILLFRTQYSGVSEALKEAARIDGASEIQTFFKIVMPMTKSIFATVFFTAAIHTWNDYTKPLYYITDKELYNIQYYLQLIVTESKYLNSLYMNSTVQAVGGRLPEETLPFAVAIISLIPVIVLFPFVQKYFSKGMAVGAVKE